MAIKRSLALLFLCFVLPYLLLLLIGMLPQPEDAPIPPATQLPG